MNTTDFFNRKTPGWSVSIQLRILGAVLAMLVGFCFAVSIYMHTFAEDIYSTRKKGLEAIISLAHNSINPILEDKKNGKITIGDARIGATEIVNQLVYYNQEVATYVFLATYEGYILVEQPFPETVGTYQMQRKDAYGNRITKLLLEKAQAGGGFVEYYEPKLSGEKPQKKISYVIGIPEIECYLGTGIYVDDIDDSIDQLKQKLLWLGFIILIVVLILQYYFLRPFLRYQYWLSDVFEYLSNNPATVNSIQMPPRFNNADNDQLLANLHLMLLNFNNRQQSIEKNVEKFRQIAYATSDVIWEWNGKSRTTEWSGNIQKLIGYEPSGFGAHFEVFDDWVYHDDRKKRHQALASYFSGSGEFYTAEYRLYNSAKNEYNWVLAKGIGTFDKNKAPIQFIGSINMLPEFSRQNNLEFREEHVRFELSSYQNITDIVQLTPSFNTDALVIDVKKRLDSELWQGVAVVSHNKPVGLVMRDALNYQLSSQYGVSLYYGRPIKIIMDEQPLIVDSGCSLEQVAELVRNREPAKQYDLIIVTDRGEYRGTVSVIDLLSSITDLRIMLATNANPLTELPGNRVIEEKLKQAVQQNFAALYIDLDNFKAFNDKYGFEMGDKAIKITASILKEIAAEYDEKDAFLGHIGGDDFLVLLYNLDREIEWAERIIAEFDAQIPSLYSQEDLARGYIIVPDRRGDKQDYPIMGISIALVDNRNRQFTNYLEVSEVAAQLKKKAKMIQGSTWVCDQRGPAI